MDNPAFFAHLDDDDALSAASSEASVSASVHCCQNSEEEDDETASRTTTAELSWAEDNQNQDRGGAGMAVLVPAARRASNDSGTSAVSGYSLRRSRRRSSIGFDLPTGLERRDSLERQHSELEASHSELLAEHRRLETENEALRMAMAKLERERNVARTQANEWRSVVQDATRNLGVVSERSRRFEAKLGKLGAEHARIEAENSRLREERDRARLASRRLRKERNSVRKALQVATSEAAAERGQDRRSLPSRNVAPLEENSDSAPPASAWTEKIEAVHNDSISSFSWLRRSSLGVSGEASSAATLSASTEVQPTVQGMSPNKHDSGEGQLELESLSKLQEQSAAHGEQDDEQEAGAPIRGARGELLGNFTQRSEASEGGEEGSSTSGLSSSSAKARNVTGNNGMWLVDGQRRSIDMRAAGEIAVIDQRGGSDGRGPDGTESKEVQKLGCSDEGGRRSLKSSAMKMRREWPPIAECA